MSVQILSTDLMLPHTDYQHRTGTIGTTRDLSTIEALALSLDLVLTKTESSQEATVMCVGIVVLGTVRLVQKEESLVRNRLKRRSRYRELVKARKTNNNNKK